jgi:hypothetical protein
MMFTSGKDRRQLVAGIGSDAHERAGAQRQLPGIARQHIEPDGGQRQDQERDHDRGKDEVVDQKRDGDRDRDRQHHADAIFAQRQDRLIGPVGRLELASFAVIHRSIPYTLSMIFSPNRPCGRNSRKTSAIM